MFSNVLVLSILFASFAMITSTKVLSEPSKKKLEIIIGGRNYCKTDKDCAGDSYCHNTNHICISCPKPFKWVNGTQCVCPDGIVPNADNTDCVECMSDENCQALKGNLHWECNTDSNTCQCLSSLHEEKGVCVCDNTNKIPNEDGNCICQINQTSCPNSDFTGENNCNCCPTETPKWNGLECKTCAEVDNEKPYYNPAIHECVECLTDGDCTNGVCINNSCYPCREDADCAGNQVCDTNQCVCLGLQEWNEEKQVCECNDDMMPTGDNVDWLNCSCKEGYDLIQQPDGSFICVDSCPAVKGMTGTRNDKQQCLCDTSLGYSEISIDNTFCQCNEELNYYAKPDGSCLTCSQTTKEWFENYISAQTGVDYNSIDEAVWYCNYMKWDKTYGELWYNPSTKSYCAYKQVLKKNANGQFYCTTCGAGFRDSGNGRTTQWGFCACARGWKWNGVDCVNSCSGTNEIYNGKCSCKIDQWTFDGITCYGAACPNNTKPVYGAGSIVFNYDRWKANVPEHCYSGVSAGRANQTSTGECGFEYGCYMVQDKLPPCSYGSKINECTCDTGGTIGSYCCSAQQVVTANGCTTCSGRTIVNANRTACTTCPDGTVPNAKKSACETCPDGQIPNVSGTGCSPCPANKIKSTTGMACLLCEDGFVPDEKQMECIEKTELPVVNEIAE